MCKIEDKEFFELLHRDYYTCDNEKERIVLRNAILQQAYPLIEATVRKLSNNKFNEDLFQHLVLKTIDTNKRRGLINEWKPTNKSTEGYYRTCFFNCGVNFLKEVTKIRKKEQNTSPVDSPFWEVKYSTLQPELIEDKFELPPSKNKVAYDKVITLLKQGHLKGGRKHLIKALRLEFGLSEHKASDIYYHALISTREMFKDRIESPRIEIDKFSFFGRLTTYLEDKQIEDIIKVFGGVLIKIPKWKGE